MLEGIGLAASHSPEGILFGAAVEKIPFAGAPILVALASILVRLVEQIAVRNGQR